MARMTQWGTINGPTARAGGIPLFTSSNIWSNNLPAGSAQSANDGSVHPPGFTPQWAATNSASTSEGNSGNGTVTFGFGDLGAPFAHGAGNGDSQG